MADKQNKIYDIIFNIYFFINYLMKFSINKQPINISTKHLTKDQLKYIDVDRMAETKTIIKFDYKQDNIPDILYEWFALFLKYQYRLPVKYLEPEIESCTYIAQKSPIPNNSKKITDASITIEPLNQNIFKQISYTPINQAFEIGTVVSLRESILYTNEDGSLPDRKLLTSASLECPQLDKDIKYKGLCNRCIPYSSLDIGSEIIGKFTVKTSPLRESMALYRFRRPQDNILEIITPDYLNVDCKYIFELTLETIKQRQQIDKQTEDIFKNIINKL